MDKIREEFEARFPREAGIRLDDDGLYSGPWASFYNARWEAWKASRESLVLHLPHMADYVNMLGQVDKCYSYLDDLHAAIHAAGIRTK